MHGASHAKPRVVLLEEGGDRRRRVNTAPNPPRLPRGDVPKAAAWCGRGHRVGGSPRWRRCCLWWQQQVLGSSPQQDVTPNRDVTPNQELWHRRTIGAATEWQERGFFLTFTANLGPPRAGTGALFFLFCSMVTGASGKSFSSAASAA